MIFHPRSFINEPLPAVRPRLDSRSAACVAKLASWALKGTQPITVSTPTVPAKMHVAGNPWFNQHRVYYADADTPRKRVSLAVPGAWWLQQSQQPLCESVPIPDVAAGDESVDKSLVIIDPIGKDVWDFYKFARAADGSISALCVGLISDYPTHGGAYNESNHPPDSFMMGTHWGVQASGFSHAAGLTMVAELQAGVIDHAVSMALPWAQKDRFSHPAQRTDGIDTTPSAIPYGAKFALPASFSIDAYVLERRKTVPTYAPTTITRIVAEAWRTHGMVPQDQDGQGVGLQVESASSWMAANPGQPNPYTALLSGVPANIQMSLLPWEKLQMIQTDMRRR